MNQRLISFPLCLTLGGCSLLFEPGIEPGGGSCSELGDFGTPTLVSIPVIVGAEEPTLSRDLLEIIFDGREDAAVNNSVLFSATRNSVADGWDAPRRLTEISLTNRESNPTLSADGQILRFCGGTPYHIYVSKRLASGGFGLPVLDLMPEVDASCPGWFNEEETFMVFDVGLAEDAKLFVTRREDADQPWGEPIELIADQPLPVGVGSPSYLECAGELWFHGEAGLYAAKWEPTENALSEIRLMGEFTGTVAGQIRNPWPSQGGKRIFFSVGEGGGKVYEATRSNQ